MIAFAKKGEFMKNQNKLKLLAVLSSILILSGCTQSKANNNVIKKAALIDFREEVLEAISENSSRKRLVPGRGLAVDNIDVIVITDFITNLSNYYFVTPVSLEYMPFNQVESMMNITSHNSADVYAKMQYDSVLGDDYTFYRTSVVTNNEVGALVATDLCLVLSIPSEGNFDITFNEVRKIYNMGDGSVTMCPLSSLYPYETISLNELERLSQTLNKENGTKYVKTSK